MSEICPKCGMSHVPYGSLEQPSPYCPVDTITVSLPGEPTPEPRESVFYCDTFKGGVFGPQGLIVPTDELHGNEVRLLEMGRIAGAKETVERMRKWAEKNSFAFSDYQVGQIRLFLDSL